MKLLSTLTIAGLMSAGSALAAATPTATAGATATPAAAPAKRAGGTHCARQAREKKLTGEAQKTFIKECREGKQAN